MVDWTEEKIGVSQPATQSPDDLQQLIKILNHRLLPQE